MQAEAQAAPCATRDQRLLGRLEAENAAYLTPRPYREEEKSPSQSGGIGSAQQLAKTLVRLSTDSERVAAMGVYSLNCDW
jgi:hypothetical protein